MIAFMVDIVPPKRPDDYADKALDCEFALEPAFQELARRAEGEGWSEDDVAAALTALAHHHLMGIIDDRKTQTALSRARRASS